MRNIPEAAPPEHTVPRPPVAPASVKGGSTSLPPKPPPEKLLAPVAGRGALGGSQHTSVGQWVVLTPALFHDQCLRDFQGGFVSLFFFFYLCPLTVAVSPADGVGWGQPCHPPTLLCGCSRAFFLTPLLPHKSKD